MKEGTLSLGGHDYHYKVSGKENSTLDPVLFVSGAFQSMKSWKPFERVFSKESKVIRVDLPGIGTADDLSRDHGLDYLSDCLHYLLHYLDIEKSYIIAASYGTPIAYKFASSYPENVSKMCLCGTMYQFTDELKEKIKILLDDIKNDVPLEQFSEDIINGLMCQEAGKEIANRERAEYVLRKSLVNFDREKYIENSWRLLLHENEMKDALVPHVESLIFTGEHDTFTRPHECKEVADNLPGSLFTMVKNADHLVHLEQPEKTMELITRFHHGESLNNIEGCSDTIRNSYKPHHYKIRCVDHEALH